MVLAPDPFCHQRLQPENGPNLILEHPSERDARPPRHHIGNQLPIDLQGNHRCVLLHRCQRLQQPVEGAAPPPPRTPCRRPGRRKCLKCSLRLADLRHEGLFAFEAPVQDLERLRLSFDRRIQFRKALAVCGRTQRFPLQGRLLLSQSGQALPCVLQLRRGCALPECDARAGGIEHTDGLVGQLSCANVAAGQAHGFDHRFFENPDSEMRLQRGHRCPQHRAGECLVRLIDPDDLKATRQGGILVDVLLVLRPGRRPHSAQLPARERRFEQVRGIALPRRPTRTDQSVRLIDEQDNRTHTGSDFVDDALETLLELTLHARACLQQADIKCEQIHIPQRRRHIATGEPNGEALDHCGLSNPGLTRKHGVVLPSPHQDVDHPANLCVTPDHRIQLPRARQSGQADRKAVERRGTARRWISPGARKTIAAYCISSGTRRHPALT